MLGAIVKAGAKSLAKDKAKSFITGKGKGKGGALKKTGEQKPKVNPSNLMGRQVGGNTGGANIPASQQTINVTALGSDAPVGTGGGSGDAAIVKDISIAVSSIAQTMQEGLVLKEKAKRKNRIAAERDKRAAKETATEKPKEKEKNDGGMPQFKVPGVGLLQGIFGFITKFLYGIVIMKLIEFAPKLIGVLNLFKKAVPLIEGLFNFTGGLLDGLASFIDFGYKLVDGAEKIVGKLFGEEGAKKFTTFMENIKPLLNAFLVWKIIGKKIFTAIITRLKNAFKLVKGFIRRGANLVTKLFPQLGKVGSKLITGAKGLASKGLAKVGGFAAKIFGKAAGIVSPALKGALPAVKGFSKRIPVLGPIIVGIVSLMSGEPAAQALFKAGGAALGGALGTFIPIPILGTLIGETIGVFVGDLLYELIMGGGMEAVGQKLKDTFKTFIKPIFDFFKDGFGRFIEKFKENNKGFAGVTNWLALLDLTKTIPLLAESFLPNIFGGDESKKEIKPEAEVDKVQDNKNGKNATEVAKETTYESGEGNAVIIPVPIPETKQVAIKNKRGRTVGYKTVVIDDSELALYGGK